MKGMCFQKGPSSHGFPGGTVVKNACQCRRHRRLGFSSWVGKVPGGGIGNPLQFSCLENSYGQRNLEGYSPWGCKESDMTEQLTLLLILGVQTR